MVWTPIPRPRRPPVPVADPAAPLPPAAPPRSAYDLEQGVVDLRPLTFTDVLDGSFALYRTTLRVVVPLVLLVSVPLQLLSAFLQREALSFGLTGLLDDPAAAAVLFGEGGATPALLLTVVAQVLVAPVLSGALCLIAGRAFLGDPVSLGEAVGRILRTAGWLILAQLAAGGLRLLPLLLVAGAIAAGTGLLVGVTVALAVLIALLLTPLFALVVPAIVLEPTHPVEGFRHAVSLARGDYVRTAGVVVGTTLVFNLLAVLLAGIPNAVGFLSGIGFAWVLVAFGSVLGQLILAPLTAASMVLLHADLRVRREGLDFDVLIRRMRGAAG